MLSLLFPLLCTEKCTVTASPWLVVESDYYLPVLWWCYSIKILSTCNRWMGKGYHIKCMACSSEKETLSHSGYLIWTVFQLQQEPVIKGSIPKVKCFSVFFSWCCSLANGVEVWVSSGSGILSIVNTDELIHGDQLTGAKTEECNHILEQHIKGCVE